MTRRSSHAPAHRPGVGERVIGGFRQPPPGVPFPSILRHHPDEGWRSGLGLAAGFILYILIIGALPTLLIALLWPVAGGGTSYEDYLADAMAYVHPVGMVATNLALGTMILLAWFLVAVAHRTRPRWLASVQPRLRWTYLGICTAVALVVFNVMQAVSWLITGTVVDLRPQDDFWVFMVIVLLTTWVQATGEEYFFRGYMMQSLGALMASPWFGVIASSVVFALFHGTQNLPLFLNRLAFGLVAGLLVWRTGGLEAGIAGHVINNIFAYFWAGLTTGIAATRTITEIGWAEASVGVGMYGLYALLAWLIARRMGLQTHTDTVARLS